MTVNELRKAFDECNLLIPPFLTKKNTSDPADSDQELQPDNDRSTRHQIGTTICKSFDNIECEGEIVHWNHNDQLHQIPLSDGDQQQMWHDEVKQHLLHTKNPKKVEKQRFLFCISFGKNQFGKYRFWKIDFGKND